MDRADSAGRVRRGALSLPALSRFERGRNRPRWPKPSSAAREQAADLPVIGRLKPPPARKADRSVPGDATAGARPLQPVSCALQRPPSPSPPPPRPPVPSPNSPASPGTGARCGTATPRTRPPPAGPRAARAGRAGRAQHSDGKGGLVIRDGPPPVQSRIGPRVPGVSPALAGWWLHRCGIARTPIGLHCTHCMQCTHCVAIRATTQRLGTPHSHHAPGGGRRCRRGFARRRP
jgi:hypothetical protein